MAGGAGSTREAVSLTQRSIDAIRPTQAAYRVPDQRCKGLAIRVAPSGLKSWDLAYRVKRSGKVTRLSLGRATDVSLEKARERANALTSAARSGRDLLAEEAELRAANAARMAPVHDDGEIKAAITSLAQTQGGGLVVMADPFLGRRRRLILETVARHRLPAVYPFSAVAEPRGLITYGPDILDIHRRSADYVDRILKGANPANLPVQAPIKFELIINLTTAKALGLTVSPTLLNRADKVIE